MGATSVVIDQMVSAVCALGGTEHIDEQRLAAGNHRARDRALQHAKRDQRRADSRRVRRAGRRW